MLNSGQMVAFCFLHSLGIGCGVILSLFGQDVFLWLVDILGARESSFRNIKTIAECLADELMNAAKVSVVHHPVELPWKLLCCFGCMCRGLPIRMPSRRKMNWSEWPSPTARNTGIQFSVNMMWNFSLLTFWYKTNEWWVESLNASAYYVRTRISVTYIDEAWEKV